MMANDISMTSHNDNFGKNNGHAGFPLRPRPTMPVSAFARLRMRIGGRIAYMASWHRYRDPKSHRG